MTPRSRRTLGLAFLVGVLPVQGWLSASQEEAATGCYAVRTAVWSRPLTSGERFLHAPPDTFRLYAVRGRDREGGGYAFEIGQTLVRPRKPRPPWLKTEDLPSASWRRNGADSVVVTWTNGFTGARLAWAEHGDSLTGRASWISDALGPEPHPSASVVVAPVPCPPHLPDRPERR